MYFIGAAAVAFWFWFSLSPGTGLGFAFGLVDWGRLLRNLNMKQLQSKTALRAAGYRSALIQGLFFVVAIALSVVSDNYTVEKATHTLLAIIGGLLFGLATLLWATRPSGWYGLD